MTRDDLPVHLDITPDWSGVLPALVAVVTEGDIAGRQLAWIELRRMAALADRYVADRREAATVDPDGRCEAEEAEHWRDGPVCGMCGGRWLAADGEPVR